MVKLRRNLLLCLLSLFVAGSAFAQTSNGTLVGDVKDASDAAVTGATVTATSLDTGVTRSTVSSATGAYRVESLPPGKYKIVVTASGFQTSTVESITIPASVVTTADITVKIGAGSQEVDVQANNSTLNTDNGQISGTIGTLEISTLPINSLNPYELALTLPGVTSVT